MAGKVWNAVVGRIMAAPVRPSEETGPVAPAVSHVPPQGSNAPGPRDAEVDVPSNGDDQPLFAPEDQPSSPETRPPTRARTHQRGADLGLRLTGELQRVDRVLTVQPGSVALVFEPGAPLRLALPGERLTPGLLPGTKPPQILVVNTAPVNLDITVEGLSTLDGQPIASCTLRVIAQVSDADRYTSLLLLAGDVGTGLEAYLLQRVQSEVTAGVQAAVKMNRLGDLRRLTMQQVLTDRWLPPTFAAGVVLRRSFTVLAVTWPLPTRTTAAALPTPALPASALPASALPALGPATADLSTSQLPTTGASRPGQAPDSPAGPARGEGSPPDVGLELSIDARLRRIWQRNAGEPLLGVVAAKARGAATVLAVAARPLGAYETEALREAYGRFLGHRRIRLVVAVGESYEELVRSWRQQVDGTPRRRVDVRTDRNGLRLTLSAEPDPSSSQIHESQGPQGPDREGPDQESQAQESQAQESQAQEGRLSIGGAADREALRLLLPFESVEFVAAVDQAVRAVDASL